MIRRYIVLLAVILVLVQGIYRDTYGAILYVTTTMDQVPGSLRNTINNACANRDDDTIYLPAGIYVLNGPAGDDRNTSGDLDFDTGNKITIIGSGAAITTIDGNYSDRVLHIIRGTISIKGVTIRGGKTREGTGAPTELYFRDGEYGGGIYNNAFLILSGCYIFENITGNGGPCDPNETAGNGGHGGGIYNDIDGILNLTDCFVSNNETGTGGTNVHPDGDCFFGTGGHGGGIYNKGTQTLTRCTISANITGNGGSANVTGNWSGNGGDGGGIFNIGTETLYSCYITDNRTGNSQASTCSGCESRGGNGGGICNDAGHSVLNECIIRSNTTGYHRSTGNRGWGGHGAGIYNQTTMAIFNCSIYANTTGNGTNAGHGAGIYTSHTLQISNSSIYQNHTGNSNSNGNGGYGGGIYNCATISISNCTISSNSTGNGKSVPDDLNPGSGGDGGGIYNNGTLTLNHSTIFANVTGGHNEPPNQRDSRNGFGGGIFNNNEISIKNTILAGNSVPLNSQGPDGYGFFVSYGYNLIQDTQQCRINGLKTGNITGLDPMLQELAYNGGITKTHALLPGSPALDSGASAMIEGSVLTSDQRGYLRPSDISSIPNIVDGCDIGAYEAIGNLVISGKISFNQSGLKNVTLTFSNNGGSTSTDPDGKYFHTVPYGWSGRVTPGKIGYIFTPVYREYAILVSPQADQDFIASANLPVMISLDRQQLYFGADNWGNQTGSQEFSINTIGQGTLNWTISHDAAWLTCQPCSGSGPSRVTVSINPIELTPGTYTAGVSIVDPNVSNSPQTLIVRLKIAAAGRTLSPLGTLETPGDNMIVQSSIPVTGWVLDDLMVESVKIFREPVESEGQEPVYIGDGVMVEGARPDVAAVYPTYPYCEKAGWGYMLLTNGLPNGGNGTYTLIVVATDVEGNRTTLGKVTVHSDNEHATQPFGAIDTPTQGGTVSGNRLVNFGWVLTPIPNTIPANGSTIIVYVDGIPLGHPVYNEYRADIEAIFPGYNNSKGAAGYFYIDTTVYENGIHTIQWTATDDGGNRDGIGSRFFTISNPGAVTGQLNSIRIEPLLFAGSNRDDTMGIHYRKGVTQREPFQRLQANENRDYFISLDSQERLELDLRGDNRDVRVLAGYLVAGKYLRPLPIGSRLECEAGIFYWLPGPGFRGDFPLVFFINNQGTGGKIEVNIRIK